MLTPPIWEVEASLCVEAQDSRLKVLFKYLKNKGVIMDEKVFLDLRDTSQPLAYKVYYSEIDESVDWSVSEGLNNEFAIWSPYASEPDFFQEYLENNKVEGIYVVEGF